MLLSFHIKILAKCPNESPFQKLQKKKKKNQEKVKEAVLLLQSLKVSNQLSKFQQLFRTLDYLKYSETSRGITKLTL